MLKDSQSIQCPHCGECLEITLDVSEGNAEYITDCEVCCRPMTVTVQVEDGEIADVQVQSG